MFVRKLKVRWIVIANLNNCHKIDRSVSMASTRGTAEAADGYTRFNNDINNTQIYGTTNPSTYL